MMASYCDCGDDIFDSARVRRGAHALDIENANTELQRTTLSTHTTAPNPSQGNYQKPSITKSARHKQCKAEPSAPVNLIISLPPARLQLHPTTTSFPTTPPKPMPKHNPFSLSSLSLLINSSSRSLVLPLSNPPTLATRPSRLTKLTLAR